MGAPAALGRAVAGAAGRVVEEVEDAADAAVDAVKGTVKAASDKVTDTAESAVDSINDTVGYKSVVAPVAHSFHSLHISRSPYMHDIASPGFHDVAAVSMRLPGVTCTMYDMKLLGLLTVYYNVQ